jgi:hypothetical protein
VRIPLTIAYITMATFLVFGSAGRVALMLNQGADLDPLPIIGAILGACAYLLLIPAAEIRRHQKRAQKGLDDNT